MTPGDSRLASKIMDPRRYRQIYAELSARIDGGTYPPGSPLPPIGRLADEFEVSRDTVQRSIHMLADDEKVTRWPGLGWYVSEGGKGLGRSIIVTMQHDGQCAGSRASRAFADTYD